MAIFVSRSHEYLLRYIIYCALLPFTQLWEVSYRYRMQGGCRCWKLHHYRCCHPPTTPTIPHHQAIASTSILVEIARELAKTHPIKHKPSLTHLPNYTPIKHHHYVSSCGTTAIHWQWQSIPHHQAIASTSILTEIARELAKTHPIKHKPSLAPPKIRIDQTLPFRKQLWHHCHSPTTLNNFSRSGYCLHLNSRKASFRRY